MTNFLESIEYISLATLIAGAWVTFFIGLPAWILFTNMTILVYGSIVTFLSGGLYALIALILFLKTVFIGY